MGAIWQDLRHASRMLRRTPAFTFAAVITLALGIGANTAIFSVVESVLLRPLPYKDPSRLVQVTNTYPPLLPQAPNSAGDFQDFRQRAQTFSGMAAYIDTPRGLNLTGEGEPARLEMRYATSGLFPLLGVQLAAGRGFTPGGDSPGAPPTVLISHHVWQQRFGLSPAVVGRTLTLDGGGYTVIGVLREDFALAPATDIWLPMGQYDSGPDPYRYHEFDIIGRLKPGVRIRQAQAELSSLNARQQKAFPDTHKNFGVSVRPLENPSAGKMRTALLVLLGAVGLVLLVACSNFANLLMTRNAARRRELAARVALGASRSRLLSHLLAESVALSLTGGVAGILFAGAGLRMLRVLVPPDLASLSNAGLNLWVLAFTLVLSFLSGVGSGLIPAVETSRLDLHEMLKESTRATGAPARQAARRVLVVSEIALAIILLTGAGLLIRSFQRLMDVNPGFRPGHVLALEIDRPQLPPAEQARLTNEQRLANLRKEFTDYERLVDRIQAIPGVEAAGGISVLPLGTMMRSASRFLVEGQPVPANGVRPVAETRSVSPGYFAAIGIPLIRGRWLDARDSATQNVVVNQAFADRFWSGGKALGKRFNLCSLAPEPCWSTVVGVVGNVHQYGLEAGPTFDSYSAVGWQRYTVVRTAPDPRTVTRAVIAEIHKFDATLPVTHVLTLDRLLSESAASRRLSAFLLGLFALLALLLAAIGVYAVMSYAVRQRTKEIGVRVALGARPGNIWRLVIESGARMVLAGIATGTAGALVLTRLLSALLYGVTATDPLTFGGVALLLACVALAACYIPARQAMRIDPAAALRLD
ncbi:MAG TPA: ABC transporter permease [Bryobacteraceae bacterium]|nr:ABC transporter permease [Bryobacteraceae bacterium]